MKLPVTEYCVDRDLVDQHEARRACHAVLDVVLPRARTIYIDAYSDVEQLPPEGLDAQKTLFAMGRAQGSRDLGMGIALDPKDENHVRLLREFAALSIYVEIRDEDVRPLADFDDSGLSICFNVTEQELTRIVSGLGDLPVVMLKELHARRRRRRLARARQPDRKR